MSHRRPPSTRGDPTNPDEEREQRHTAVGLDTLEHRPKRSGRQRPAPSRGRESMVDPSAERLAALVVGALPAHVEIVLERSDGLPYTRSDVQIVKVHPGLVAALQSPLVVGDRVTLARIASGQLLAVDAKERETLLARPAVGREALPQPLVANAGVLWVVVAAANPPMRPAMVDRFLVAAAAGGLDARLCATKSDIPADDETVEWFAFYERIGLPVIRTSVKTGDGLPQMQSALAGSFSVLVGQSGVGKSSIVRAILPEQPIAVGEVSEATGKGRHTTTVTRYYHLTEGGAVVDTPGLRELGLWGADRSHLDIAFPDIAELARSCRFANCHHEQEPGCTVREAAEVPSARLASFRKLSEEIDQRLRPGFGKPGGPAPLR